MLGYEGNIMDGNYGFINVLLGLAGKGILKATSAGVKVGYIAIMKRAYSGDAEAQYEFAKGLYDELKNKNYDLNREITDVEIDEVMSTIFDFAEKAIEQGNKKAVVLLEDMT